MAWEDRQLVSVTKSCLSASLQVVASNAIKKKKKSGLLAEIFTRTFLPERGIFYTKENVSMLDNQAVSLVQQGCVALLLGQGMGAMTPAIDSLL